MEKHYAEVIKAFHLMWDTFPGIARLIDRQHNILAANNNAYTAGLAEGKCILLGAPEGHKGCLGPEMFRTHTAQTDSPGGEKIRGWMPVPDYDDIYVHFSIPIPKRITDD